MKKEPSQKDKVQGCAVLLVIIAGLFIWGWASCEDETAPPLSPEEQVIKDHEEVVNKCFSGWDGSHLELSKFIVKALNDPDSYKHYETIYWDNQDHLIINMTYGGKNGFGGMVKLFVKAKADVESCTILEIIESRQL